MEQAGREMRWKWKLRYLKSRKEICLEIITDPFDEWRGPRKSEYTHKFNKAECNLLKFLFVELYTDAWVTSKEHRCGHDIKRVQQALGNIVYNKMGERDEI